ncbi:phosphonate degradation HD-domain oxygenase [Aeoliella sp. SH292]|uniref:phosphonate degradation HD-domain oxygenase n=1 Tax=Aeoliella sp. SH292 TaxID=3454464 RepID=UPI003F9A4136
MASTDTTATFKRTTDEVRKMFEQGGDSQYGHEQVTQIEHALQAAFLAEREGASDELVTAALLHDIGHLLHHLPSDAPEQGIDDLHEVLAAEWLARRFPAIVLETVRLHVDSKRYLSAAEPGYWATLSEPSQLSLELQGGPFTDEECEEFRRGEYFEDAIRVRRWDDLAKIENLETPPLEHYLQVVDRVALASN